MRILELHLLTENLAKTADFYHGMLGFELSHYDEHLLTIAAGETLLNFRPAHGAPCLYHFAFEVPNNKFDDAYEWFSELVEFIPITPDTFIADFVNWKAKSFYFFDNQGNILECIARFDADTHSSVKFTSSSINYISEIGIVADDVPQMIHQLQLDFNIPPFPKHLPQPEFGAVGDDQGLFILAAKNRLWYPTDRPASKCLTRIIFEQHSREFDWIVNDL